MGRGLSETQRRILLWIGDNYHPGLGIGGVSWFDSLTRVGKRELAGAILDRPWSKWTGSDRSSVSRALRRLEARGLISRIAWVGPELVGCKEQQQRTGKGRTADIMLTPQGKEAVRRIRAEMPKPAEGD